MKQNIILSRWMLGTILILSSAVVHAQTKRSEEFRTKYKLTQVVVFSRHNIRSPLASNGAVHERVTPYKWYPWSSPGSHLSLRGGVLETEMGQFFRLWLVNEGLIPDSYYRPNGDKMMFYANSRQRTIATAKYFSAGFLPYANIRIMYKLDEDKMDPVFTPQFTKMNELYRQKIYAEMLAMHGGYLAWMQFVQPALTLIEEIINMVQSPAAQNDTLHFRFDDTQFKLEKGDEPRMTGGYALANSVADALVLQCYESESMMAFGHELTLEQWRAICSVKEVYDGLLFTTHSAAVNLAYPLVSLIHDELHHEGRKFTYLCGHDSNLASIGAALRFVFPETEQALELHTPIGSKLVFEKWSDGSEEYVAINLVYQSLSQLHQRTLLSLDEPPMVLPVTIEGLTTNADGLYRLADLDARMAEAMAEYDAIEDN